MSPEFSPGVSFRSCGDESPEFADTTPDDIVQAVWNHAALVANASILKHQETVSAAESDSNSGSFLGTRIRAPTHLFLPSYISAGAGETTLYHQETTNAAESDSNSGSFLDSQPQGSAHLSPPSYVSAGGDLVLETMAPVVPPYNPARSERIQPVHVMPSRRADETVGARACEDHEHMELTAGGLEDRPKANVVGKPASVEAPKVKAQEEGQRDEKRVLPGPSPRAGTGPSGFSRLRQAWEARAGGKTVILPREDPTRPE